MHRSSVNNLGSERCAATSGDDHRTGLMPRSGQANRLLGGDHGDFILARLRPGRDRRQKCSNPLAYTTKRSPWGGRSLLAITSSCRPSARFLSEGSCDRSSENPVDSRRDRGVPAGALVLDGSAGDAGVGSLGDVSAGFHSPGKPTVRAGDLVYLDRVDGAPCPAEADGRSPAREPGALSPRGRPDDEAHGRSEFDDTAR